MSRRVLEVLIPTYCRPQSAIGAIDSVLSGTDPRVSVFCHSNGIDFELEAAAAKRPMLRYGCFPENRGAVNNFREVLEGSRADYVLFLSDEDRIDTTRITDFVDFLSQNQHGFVFCGVVESTGEKYFSVAELECESLSLEDMLIFFTIHPTYMSGYCFRRDLLTDEMISATFEDHEANVYPHLMLRNAIAINASIGLYASNLIIKGAEANTGGDSHAHLQPTAVELTSQALRPRLLNPRIYSEGARARQFYYLAPRLERDLAPLPSFWRAYTKLYVLSAWLKITSDAHLHVDATVVVARLESIISECRSRDGGIRGIVGMYNRILSIRQPRLKAALVKTMWYVTKFVKLILFFQRFGVWQTFAFVRTKQS